MIPRCHSVHESSPESRFYTDPCTPRRAVRAPIDIACLTSLYCVHIAVTTISLFRFRFSFPFPPFTVARLIVCEDGKFKFMVYEHILKEGTMQVSLTNSELQSVLREMNDSCWSVSWSV